jgi:hypothetical protein
MAQVIQIPIDADILNEEGAYAYAEHLRSLDRLATNLDAMSVALRKRIINQLRHEGLDAAAGGARGFFGGASDAVRTADKAIAPLRAAQQEADNIARAGVLFRRNMQTMVFEPIREARKLKKRETAGLDVR